MGNKCDLENQRQVTYDEGKNFADTNGMLFLETSAKECKNVYEVFKVSASKILDNIYKNEDIQFDSKGNIKINKRYKNNSNNKNRKKCC